MDKGKRTLEELCRAKESGKEFVVWKLSEPVLEQVKKEYTVQPWLIRVKSQHIPDIGNTKSSMLRSINFAAVGKRRREYQVFQDPSENEYRLLNKYNIKYSVLKYKIILR